MRHLLPFVFVFVAGINTGLLGIGIVFYITNRRIKKKFKQFKEQGYKNYEP